MVSMKYVCLVVLVIQTVSNVLLVRRARHLNVSLPVVVLCQEFLKLLTCILIVLYNEGLDQLRRHVIKDWLTTLKVGVPAFLYVIQNQLLFVSLANLDPATYQITYQLKILTTAVFSIVLLHKSISKAQWLSLVILTVGVILVQWRGNNTTTSDNTSESSMTGLVCILAACVTSGFAGVFFEMMLKNTGGQSVWIRNTQLALCSCVVATVNLLITERTFIATKGLFHDFQPVVYAVILSQAYGGLLIGLVVKYADNILKVFATSVSIILSSLVGIFYFAELSFTLNFGVGLVLVLTSTVLYSAYPAKKKAE
ncbi:hypothetical protein ACHWQZ_G016791 [Mnemiopsis leidyi]